MNRRGGTRLRATRKPVVVLAGEDRNDRRVLRLLLEEFCPDMRGRIVEIAKSVPLRDASAGILDERVRRLGRLARARAERERADLACLFVHEDLDRPGTGGYDTVRKRVQDALRREFGSAHYVLAVAETEAWLLLFPDALTGYTSGWKVPRRYRGCDTSQLADPKRVMMNDVSGAGRTYRESDAPEVVARVLKTGNVRKPIGTNQSWTELWADATDCCRTHLRAAG